MGFFTFAQLNFEYQKHWIVWYPLYCEDLSIARTKSKEVMHIMGSDIEYFLSRKMWLNYWRYRSCNMSLLIIYLFLFVPTDFSFIQINIGRWYFYSCIEYHEPPSLGLHLYSCTVWQLLLLNNAQISLIKPLLKYKWKKKHHLRDLKTYWTVNFDLFS